MQTVDSGGTPATAAPALERARGHLRLSVVCPNDGTGRIADLFQEGCLKVRLPRPKAHGDVELVVMNIGGGLTGGDRLSVDLTVGDGACATVTTPACERIYRSLEGEVVVEHRLRVGRRARLDWIPQETILFQRGRLRRRLDVELDADAELTLAESVLLGRVAMGETVTDGFFADFWTIRRNQRLLFADAIRIAEPFERVTGSPTALGGCNAMASLVHVGQDRVRKRDALLAGFASCRETAAGASVVGELLVARIAAPSGGALRRALVPALACLRDPRALPRLWFC